MKENSLKIKFYRFIIRKLRNKDGRIWERLRSKYYSQLFKKAGDDIKIRCGVIIKEMQNIQAGNHISIQENCFISGYGGLNIGDNVSIGTGTFIFTSSHPIKGIIRNNALEKCPVEIGNNVWIGAGVRILGNVKIGDNVVVGAGAVVTRDLSDNGVYVGSPAKKIHALKLDTYEK